MEQKEEVERWPQLKKKKRRSLSVERLRGLFFFKSSPKAKAKTNKAAAAPRGRSPTRAQIRVPFDKPAAPAPAAKKPPAPAPAKPAKPAARQPPAPAAPAPAPAAAAARPAPAPAPTKPRRRELGVVTHPTEQFVATPPAPAPAPAAAAKPPAPEPARPAAAMPPPAPVPVSSDRPAREGSFRLVHRDKVRNTTLAFKSPKLGFTLGLWKDGWIRVQRVAQTCPHFLALAPGDALLRVGVDKVPVPFPRDDFAGLLRKLSAAPRPLELTFVRVLDDAPAPPATSPEFALVEDPPTPAAAAGGPPPVFASPPAPAPAAAPEPPAAPPPPPPSPPKPAPAPEPPAPAAVPSIFRTSGSPSTVQKKLLKSPRAKRDTSWIKKPTEASPTRRPASPSDPRAAPEAPTPPASPWRSDEDAGGFVGPTADIQPAAIRRAKAAEKADVAYAAAAESEKPETLDFFNWLSGEQDTPSKARKN